MQRLLMASILGLAACGSSAAQRAAKTAVATNSTSDGDVVCADEVSTTTGMTHRVCRKVLPSSAETGETDMVCTDETPTGSHLTKRVCRSQVERDDDKKLARDIYLDPASVVGCNPDLGRCDGQPDLTKTSPHR
jgi:hypothetical protein